MCVETDADHIKTGRTDQSTETRGLLSLGVVGSVDRVVATHAGTDLNRHTLTTIDGKEIDFTTTNPDVGSDDGEPLVFEEPPGELFAGTTEVAPVSQREISGCSSCSTLTSRKVRTCTS